MFEGIISIIDLEIEIMNRPPQLSNYSKRTLNPQYLTPRERPIVACNTPYYQNSPNNSYRSREKHTSYNTISNTSISYRECDQTKLKQGNPLDELRLKLTTLKQEVSTMISNENRPKSRNTLVKNQASFRSSSVEEFVPILSLDLSGKKYDGQRTKTDRMRTLENERQHLKRERQIWKSRYASKKAEAEREILDLSRKLRATSQKLSHTQSCFEEYKLEIESEMEEIRRSVEESSNYSVVYHQPENWKKMVEENALLKHKVEELSYLKEESDVVMGQLQQRIQAITAQNMALRQTAMEISKLSEIRADSNIFDLSKSKINVEQEKEHLTHNLNSLHLYLSSHKEQQRMLRDKILFLEDLLVRERLQKASLEREVEKARCSAMSKQRQIDQLGVSVSVINKNYEDLLRVKNALEVEINELRGETKESIIEMMASEVSVESVITLGEGELTQDKRGDFSLSITRNVSRRTGLWGYQQNNEDVSGLKE